MCGDSHYKRAESIEKKTRRLSNFFERKRFSVQSMLNACETIISIIFSILNIHHWKKMTFQTQIHSTHWLFHFSSLNSSTVLLYSLVHISIIPFIMSIPFILTQKLHFLSHVYFLKRTQLSFFSRIHQNLQIQNNIFFFICYF